ncbi:MAG: PQQ-dependent sugar dehydrogenase, partial [Candidatus Methylomirabilis sp.]
MAKPCVGVLTCLTVLLAFGPAFAAIQLDEVLTGLSSPLYVTNAHDGTNRLFIVERPGRIQVLQPQATTPTVFLDITSRVLSGGERGLLGLAFHPGYAVNRRFFVNYTRQTDGATVIAEYHASASDPNIADSGETVLLVISQPSPDHNGGMIEFGPDGFFYIGMGDGGPGNDPDNRAQDINDLLGKMLRIDIDTPSGSTLYS